MIDIGHKKDVMPKTKRNIVKLGQKQPLQVAFKLDPNF